MKRSRRRLRPCRDYTFSCAHCALGYKHVYVLAPVEKKLKRFMRFWKRNSVPIPWDDVWATFKGWQ